MAMQLDIIGENYGSDIPSNDGLSLVVVLQTSWVLRDVVTVMVVSLAAEPGSFARALGFSVSVVGSESDVVLDTESIDGEPGMMQFDVNTLSGIKIQ